MDQSVVQFLVAAVAADASLTAVLLGIDQLSSGGRLRNLESTLRAVGPDGKARDEVVASLHRSTVARLIAREAVPFKSFLVPTFFLAMGLAIPVAGALKAATPWSVLCPAGVMSSAAIGIGLIPILNLARERARIRSWYEQGLTPLRAFTNLLGQTVHGAPRVMPVAFAEGVFGSVFLFCFVRALSLKIQTTSGVTLYLIAILALWVCGVMAVLLGRILKADLVREPSGFPPSWVQPSPMSSSGAGDPETLSAP